MQISYKTYLGIYIEKLNILKFKCLCVSAHITLSSEKEAAMDWPHIKETENFHHLTGTPVEPQGKRPRGSSKDTW